MKDRIREVMESLHMTQQEFAERTQIGAATLSNIFNGRSRPSLNVVELIKKSCIENASDELEREWLEQELMEYNTHDHFWYPPELNQYASKGYFWSHDVQCVDDKWFMLPSCSHDIVLVDDLSALWWKNETDKHKMLLNLEIEAKERNKTVIVFVSPNELLDL
jgi:transcriptional regulator with XRE-family HTH domain